MNTTTKTEPTRRQRLALQDRIVPETRTRVLAAFKELRKAGFIARANFMCCSSCAGAALGHYCEGLNAEERKETMGTVFFHQQDSESFKKGYSLHLRYGDVELDDKSTVGMPTKQVGVVISALLRAQGLTVTWDGNPDKTIEVDPALQTGAAEVLAAVAEVR